MGSVGKTISALNRKSYQETTDWFNQYGNYEDWQEDIFDKEYDETIYKYTGEYYDLVNTYLRTGNFQQPNKWFEQSDMDKMVSELDYAVSSFNLKRPITVYRASDTSIFGAPNMSYEQLRSFIGKTVTDKGYLSTSTLKSLPDEQTVGGNISYVVDIPAGKGNGAYIAKYSENSQEREFLTKRSGKYIVGDITRDNQGHITVHLKLSK